MRGDVRIKANGDALLGATPAAAAHPLVTLNNLRLYFGSGAGLGEPIGVQLKGIRVGLNGRSVGGILLRTGDDGAGLKLGAWLRPIHTQPDYSANA